jgi:beta-lactamase class A
MKRSLRRLVAAGAFAFISLSLAGAAPQASGGLFLTQATTSDSAATAIPSRARFAAAADFARSRAGIVSFSVLGTTGSLRSYNAQQVYASASVVKALFLVAYLRELHSGHRPLLVADEYILDSMIRVSDNDAARTIFFRLGLPRILALARRAGMRDFTISSCC